MKTFPDQIAEANSPNADDIRTAIGRILDVHPFRDSPQLSAFLKFVVEETLLGKGGDLKGYTIATLALGRHEDFDPQTDPIVRVQAGRVRQAIQEYYETYPEDPIRIMFVRGSYIPQFIRHTMAEQNVAVQDKPKTADVESNDVATKQFIPQSLQDSVTQDVPDLAQIKSEKVSSKYAMTKQGILGVATVAAMLGMVVLVMFGILTTKLTTVSSVQHQSYFPVVMVDNGSGPSDPSELLSVMRRTQDALVRFDDMVIVRDSTDERGSSQLEPVRRKAQRLTLRITSNYADRGQIRFSARLVEQLDQSVIWVQEFDPVLSGTSGDEGRTEIVRAIASTIARPYGVVHAYARKVFADSAEKQSDFGCIMIAFDYWQHSNTEMRTQAKTCLEKQLNKNPRLGALHSQLAYLHLDDIRIDNLDEQRAPLDRAIAAAIRGVNLAPTSARSYQTLMAVHFARREMESSWRAADMALKLNPFDSEIIADVGVHYVTAGQFEKGLALLNESLISNSSPPDWVLIYRSIALYALGRKDEAAINVKPLKASEFPLAMMGTILVAFHEKDQKVTTDRINVFKNKYPMIFANPKAYFERMNLERGLMNFLLSRYQAALTWVSQST